MTSHELDNTPEQLLARAYALRGDDPNETLKLYADWAETYDHTMLDGLAYRSAFFPCRSRRWPRRPKSAGMFGTYWT